MKKLIFATVFLLAPMLALAHGDHAPKVANCLAKECTKGEIEAAVPVAVEMLAKKGNLDASWGSQKIEKVEQKKFKKGTEWVATLFDEKQKDTSKQRLYIFVTNKGYLNGSNFTGE